MDKDRSETAGMDGDLERRAALPDTVRDRLRGLAEKLDDERRGLNEARLLREAEVSSLQTELARRGEAWKTERLQLENAIDRLKREVEDFRREREDWAAQRKEWHLRLQQVMVASKQLEEKEAAWRAEKLELENAVKAGQRENERLREEHREALRKLEARHQEHLRAALDELEGLLGKSRRAASGPDKGWITL